MSLTPPRFRNLRATLATLALLLALPLVGQAFAQGEYQQAPMLEGRDLPPVEERLPENPLVVEPLEEIGTYGGTMRRISGSPRDGTMWRIMTAEPLVHWGLGENVPVPNLAESWDISDDGTVYTFHLREGMKWSDGEPFTAEDIVFWYDAVGIHPDMGYGGFTWMRVNDELTQIVAVDDHTVEFRFAGPHGLLLDNLAYLGDSMILPMHYMRQFHPDYADPDELQAAIEEAGFTEWTELFDQQNNILTNTERPTMGAWIVTQAFPQERMIAERNPYYFKVDPEGNQLPYIDTIQVDLAESGDVLTLRAAAGEIDFQYRRLRFGDLPVILEGAEESGYEVLRWPDDAGFSSLFPNLTHQDPVMRDLLQNRDFRAGLSHAIDRETINDLLLFGLGNTNHPVAMPGDPYFEEGMGDTFTSYDVEAANEHLDAAGLSERDSQGYRLRPDGERLHINLLSSAAFETGANAADIFELVTQYWEDVGISTNLDLVDRTLFFQRVYGNEHDIAGYLTAGMMWNVSPNWYVPVTVQSYYAPLYGQYYEEAGELGEEPIAEIARMQDLYDQMVVTVDEEEHLELGREILRIHDENVFIIGVVQSPFQPVIVNEDLVNVLEEGTASYRLTHVKQAWPEQFFFRNP